MSLSLFFVRWRVAFHTSTNSLIMRIRPVCHRLSGQLWVKSYWSYHI